MFSFSRADDPITLQNIKEVREQNKLNIDEYTKLKKPLTPIQSFYAGKSIFLTGATGFLGICIVEKLLRDCSDIKKLYVLVRPSKRHSVEDKIKKMFSNVVFNRLKKINPNFEDKIVVLKGDLYEKNLGITAEDRKLLMDNVNVIIHNGATVKFKEAISVALRINVLSTEAMLDLALACPHLKSFVYVSTAYSHSYQKNIKEEFFAPAADLKTVHEMIVADETAKNGLSPETTKKLLGKWLNIYTFSKSISEDLVRQYGEKAHFACTVFRPSMVFGSNKEPAIGWITNLNGPIGICMGAIIGGLHVTFDKDEPFDVVPADYSINALIACIYDATEQWENEKRPRVYNFGSSAANCVTLKKINKVALAATSAYALEKSVWHMSVIHTANKYLFFLLHFFLHCIPAVFVDIALVFAKRKPRALSIAITATKNLDWIAHFMSFGWRIQVTEMRKVFDRITEADRQLFDFDIWKLDWSVYISRTVLGAKIFLKDSIDNLEKSKRHAVLLRNIHYTFKTVFYLITAYFIMWLLNIKINFLFV